MSVESLLVVAVVAVVVMIGMVSSIRFDRDKYKRWYSTSSTQGNDLRDQKNKLKEKGKLDDEYISYLSKGLEASESSRSELDYMNGKRKLVG